MPLTRSQSQLSTDILMNSLSLLLITLTLSFSAIPAKASTPTTESITKLIALTPHDKILVEDLTRQAYAQNVNAIPQIVENTIYQQKVILSEIQTQYVEKIIHNYAETFGKEIQSRTNQGLSEQYIKSLQQTYTQKEIDAQIAFYSSPMGQQILKKQPQLLQNYMKAIVPSMHTQIKSIMQELEPKIKSDVYRVIN